MVPDYGEFVGQGGQFKVLKTELFWAHEGAMTACPVAVKHLKFELDPNSAVDYTKRSTCRHWGAYQTRSKGIDHASIEATSKHRTPSFLVPSLHCPPSGRTGHGVGIF